MVADRARDHDMSVMKLTMLIAGVMMMAVAGPAAPASAQIVPPGIAPQSPLPPAPPPPPKIEVPPVPKLDAPPQAPSAQIERRSFGDRISDCLDQAAAAGVKPSRRAAYSRACANR